MSAPLMLPAADGTTEATAVIRGNARQPWLRAAWRQRGFTLIELMIVMTLIVTLAGMALVVYGNSVTRAKEAALAENLFRMRDAIDQYYADKNRYPASLDVLVSERYLRSIPMDPFTNAADWDTTMAEMDPGNPSAEAGIYDVKSAATQMALDGTQYRDW